MSPPLVLYTTTFCWACHAAKLLLRRRGIPFAEVNLTGQPDLRRAIEQRTGRRTVPVVLVGDDVIGGYDELRALDATGELERRLRSA